MLTREQAIELLQLAVEYRSLLADRVHTETLEFGALAKLRQVSALVDECELAIFPERAGADGVNDEVTP